MNFPRNNDGNRELILILNNSRPPQNSVFVGEERMSDGALLKYYSAPRQFEPGFDINRFYSRQFIPSGRQIEDRGRLQGDFYVHYLNEPQNEPVNELLADVISNEKGRMAGNGQRIKHIPFLKGRWNVLNEVDLSSILLYVFTHDDKIEFKRMDLFRLIEYNMNLSSSFDSNIEEARRFFQNPSENFYPSRFKHFKPIIDVITSKILRCQNDMENYYLYNRFFRVSKGILDLLKVYSFINDNFEEIVDEQANVMDIMVLIDSSL